LKKKGQGKLFQIGLLLLGCYSAGLPKSWGQASTNLSLLFPKDKTVGRLILLKPEWQADQKSAFGKPLAAARGAVNTFAGQKIMLLANDCISECMPFLASLPPDALVCLVLSGSSITDKDLVYVNHLTGLRWLELEDTDIGDAGLAQLTKLNKLEYLRLSSTLVKGLSLDSLRGSPLKTLDINSVGLDATAFFRLANFKELRCLNLNRSAASDSALTPLSKLPNLELLSIADNVHVTDAGIKKLVGLKRLQRLNVANTSVTADGILTLKGIDLRFIRLSSRCKNPRTQARLQQAFPHALIEFELDRPRMPAELFAPLH
jgi:hypothetical protein